MNYIEQYNLTLQIEVAKEQNAELLAQVCSFLLPQPLDSYGFGQMTLDLAHMVNTELYMVKSERELAYQQECITDMTTILLTGDSSVGGVETSDSIIETYTDSDFEKALSRNIALLTYKKISSVKPRAILLGGQSGAGKTTIHRVKMMESQGQYIVIDGDTYRAQHPHFRALQEKYGTDSVNYTKEFAGRMVEALIDRLSKLHYNLIIEGTLRTAAVPLKTAQLLKTKGYAVDFCLIATKPELAYATTELRYLEMLAHNPLQARATPKEHHDGIVATLLTNIAELEASQVFSSMQVYTRNLQCVYSSNIDTMPMEKVVERIVFGPWSAVEEELLYQTNERIASLAKKN